MFAFPVGGQVFQLFAQPVDAHPDGGVLAEMIAWRKPEYLLRNLDLFGRSSC